MKIRHFFFFGDFCIISILTVVSLNLNKLSLCKFYLKKILVVRSKVRVESRN